ncbi:MAG: T9SS type A sorting domain-containing protein [Candidatus Cloacimonetes bacterium]|nr:T9SS type A sorting domain-containing protein [Candidatus Cloacimonadota bacterium]MCF7814168.1 T9SS type A sorting domain-containing protein [Candidatus Cloacimonadota bacterium]MCF7868769.1 T9SS type A sorting domain-containing protein [Candidatus Cloacimonadota bacterium]MCF7884172.1 T9SS type A sorting domain-containing protein [Candidatus Cloacimonadota bacterium]
MKKFSLLIILVCFVISLSAEMQQATTRNAELDAHNHSAKVYEPTSRDVPNWEIGIDPVSLITNYYDYQPGSYNSISVRVQPDGGKYMIFHGRETAASTRRVYYAYVDAAGNLTNVATIGTDDVNEGYPGISIDPETQNPITAWHGNFDESNTDFEIVVSYDLYHLGSPGLWKTPFIVIDDATQSPNMPDDEFNWPYTFIGPSPVTGKRRVYVVATNFDNAPSGDPSENVMIAFADFDENDFNAQSELDWSYRTIPQMDAWHNEDPEWMRPNGATAVSNDGSIALFGYVITDGETSTTPDQMYCFVNDNYGEGDFEMHLGQAEFDIDNPQNQDGTYRFVDDQTGQPLQLYMAPTLCNHQNVMFTDNNSKVKFLGNMNMLVHPADWFPDLPMMYPKVYTFDLNTEEFTFQDLYITGANPNDNIPMLPWDLDEDGQVDEYDADGIVTWVDGWPVFHYDYDVAFHENRWQLTQNEDNDWMVAVWSEGLKSRLGNVPEPGYEDWAEFPEIAVAISNDGGENWSDAILMNAKTDDDNYVPEFDGMIPCYVYTGDVIQDLGDGWGRVDLMFLDDNSYGSSIQGYGENLGGTMIYTAIDIEFGNPNNTEPNTIPAIVELKQNYPNPFNPSTTISYNLKEAAEVELEIFNVKGQKVRTLVQEHQNAGEHQVTWQGKDDNFRNVSSGVYFYKMKSGNLTTTKKMILLK